MYLFGKNFRKIFFYYSEVFMIGYTTMSVIVLHVYTRYLFKAFLEHEFNNNSGIFKN